MNKTARELINRRRHQILVHSYLYYQLGENIIDDYTFDIWSKELVDLQAQYPNESMAVKYYEAFKDFDGSSGFDLPYSMPNIQKTGDRLLAYARKNN
jgi:hypothetical protein